MHLPRKGWKLAIGMLIDSYGGILQEPARAHIHLFRYDKVIPAFRIIDYDNLEDEAKQTEGAD